MTASELLSAAQRAQQVGDWTRAEAGYRQLLEIEPANAELWYLLGSVCQPLGKREEMLAAYHRAVTLKPELAVAQNSLGIALSQEGRPVEAQRCFAEAIRAQPGFAQAHNNLGNALLEQGRRDEALACYQRAAALKPDFAEAYNNLGNVQRYLGRLDESIANCRQALRLKFDLADAHFNLGVAQAAKREWEAAVASFRQAAALRANHAETHRHLAGALRELGRLDEAVLSYGEALRLKPDFAEAHGDLAMTLAPLGDLDGALSHCGEVLRLRPNLASAHLYMGYLYRLLGRRSDALACLDRALELQADLPDARRNRSLVWLTEGKLAEGWVEYEWRWNCAEFPKRQHVQPQWDGSPLNGKTILLEAEQGFGDTLQFIRYARIVQKRGGRVVVSCQRSLVPLVSRCQGIEQVLAQGEPLPHFDVQTPLLCLPRIFGTTLDNLPADVPYLHGDPQLSAGWREELGSVSGFKIGIAWQGNRAHPGDRWRSVPLAHFAPLVTLGGVRLYSLQKNHGQEQLANVSFGDRIVDLAPRLESFADTAAVMENLDLVICCDSAVAHLAGALARPVWVALPNVSDWRWLLDRDDSPWYPTMRLFRQLRRDDWQEVFGHITSALARQIGARTD